MINKIGEFRVSKNMGQAEFATKLQVSQGTVSKIEKGILQPNYNFLQNMMIVFNFDVNLLLKAGALIPNEFLIIPKQVICTDKFSCAHSE